MSKTGRKVESSFNCDRVWFINRHFYWLVKFARNAVIRAQADMKVNGMQELLGDSDLRTSSIRNLLELVLVKTCTSFRGKPTLLYLLITSSEFLGYYLLLCWRKKTPLLRSTCKYKILCTIRDSTSVSLVCNVCLGK